MTTACRPAAGYGLGFGFGILLTGWISAYFNPALALAAWINSNGITSVSEYFAIAFSTICGALRIVPSLSLWCVGALSHFSYVNLQPATAMSYWADVHILCAGAFVGGLMVFLQFWPHFQVVPKPPGQFETLSGR